MSAKNNGLNLRMTAKIYNNRKVRICLLVCFWIYNGFLNPYPRLTEHFTEYHTTLCFRETCLPNKILAKIMQHCSVNHSWFESKIWVQQNFFSAPIGPTNRSTSGALY